MLTTNYILLFIFNDLLMYLFYLLLLLYNYAYLNGLCHDFNSRVKMNTDY